MSLQGYRHLARTLALLLCATAAMPLAAADSTTDFADSVGAAWVKAAKANDLEAIVKLYADDATAWFPDEAQRQGAAAIRASYKNLFDTFTVVDAALTNSHHFADASHRTNWGNFSLTLKQKSDGKLVPMTGRYTDIQEKRNGHWVYVVDHASADPAPAPVATAK
jgi:ketosteroid isomerase-like protein